MRLSLPAAVFVVLALGEPAAQLFKVDTELVTIPITVTTRDNERVSGLTAADFQVREDGVEQTIAFVDQQRRALSLCIVLDSSVSMRGWKQRQAAASVQKVIAALQPEDEATLLVFSAGVGVAVPWAPARAFPAINWSNWKVAGATPLIDALASGLELIDEARNPQPAILVISDGLENSSRISLQSVTRTRRQSETLVYAFRTEDRRSPVQLGAPSELGDASATRPTPPFAIDLLPSLVGDSGGTVQSVSGVEHADAAARALLAELGSHYIVGYAPKKLPDGKYRRIKVEVADQRWQVRHRSGYLATPTRPR